MGRGVERAGVPSFCAMAVPEEDEIMTLLRQLLDQRNIDSPTTASLGKQVSTLFKEYRRGNDTVNSLLTEVFNLEKQVQVA